jgi:hypothetical protein
VSRISSALEKLLAAVVAGALAFAVAGGALLLLIGPFEGWPSLALFAGVPAAIVAPMPFSARLFCLLSGVLAFGVSLIMPGAGPHDPIILLPAIALFLIVAALTGELSVRMLRWLFRAKGSEEANR